MRLQHAARLHAQIAAHAQVNQQRIPIQPDDNELPAPIDLHHLLAWQTRKKLSAFRLGQRPQPGQFSRLDLLFQYGWSAASPNAQRPDNSFNFGQFWHGSWIAVLLVE